MGGRRGEGREVAARKVGGGEGRGGGEEEEGGGGGWDAGGGAERGSKGQSTPGPVDARIVPGQPGESQHQLEVTQPGHLKGKVLGMGAMNPDEDRDVVSDGSSRGGTAVNEL